MKANCSPLHFLIAAQFILFQAVSLIAAERSFLPSAYAGKGEMNGISLHDYEGFQKNWKLVTVRYRTDNAEQRFVWANSIAWKALSKHSDNYPDGSVFIKMAVVTEEDPVFKSSRVPSGSLRYQVMLRNKEKYASTDGWGYALFNGDQVTVEENPKNQAISCFACHQLVRGKGEVFSEPFRVAAFSPGSFFVDRQKSSKDLTSKDVIRFEDVTFASLPELVRKSLPDTKTIRSVQGELKKNVFRGTLDEIRPRLIAEVQKTGQPAALISEDGKLFSAVYKQAKFENCPADKSLKSVFSTSVQTGSSGAAPYWVVAWQDLCVSQ